MRFCGRGTLLGNTYVIEALLGRGSMGEVYRATHAELAAEHAIKVMLPSFAEDPPALRSVIAPMLAPRPADRPPSMRALLGRDSGGSRERVRRSPQPVKHPPRRPALAALFGLIALAASGLALFRTLAPSSSLIYIA